MSAPIPLAAVWKMLRRCAKGYTSELKTHHHWVRYNGKTFRTLPTGEHGSRRPEVELHHIVGLVTDLGIDEGCAAEKYRSSRRGRRLSRLSRAPGASGSSPSW